MRFCSIALLTVLLCSTDVLVAQQVPVHSASTHVFPAGGRRGTKIDIRVGGECLPPSTRLRWFGEGLKSPEDLGAEKVLSRSEPSLRRKPSELPINHPKEWQSNVEISPDAPLGPHLWRLASASGGTGGRFFIVGDLPEFIETESNSAASHAESVTLPVTINGQIDGERDLDYFRFTAHAGEVVTAEVVAARLGLPTETLVEFFDAQGQRLSAEETRIGSDPVVAVRIPTLGAYQLVVSNLNYHGGPQYVYRVTLSTAPFVKHVFPAGWQAGAKQTFELSLLTGNGSTQAVREDILVDSALTGNVWLQRAPLGANPLPLDVSNHVELVEQEPNPAEQPSPLPAESMANRQTLTINGRIMSADDEDCFQFNATAGTMLSITCVPAPRSATTLPSVSICDASGNVLATRTVEDPIERVAKLDPWTAPADGEYRVRVRDLRYGSTGGSELTYRLTIGPAIPDFSITLPADLINVVQGAKVDVDARVVRKGGFSGPVKLSVENLPAGVTADPLEVAAGVEAVKLSITADAEARPIDVPVRIIGTAEINGATTTHVGTAAHLAHDPEGISVGPLTIDHVQLIVQHKPVFKLFCSEAYQYAHRGTVHPYLMEVERLDGFDAPIVLEVADRQIKDLDGIEVLNTTIQPGSSNTMLPLYLPETMHINVQAHSNVYSQGYTVFTDKWGQRQSMLVVSTMRCMIRPLPTIARLRAMDAEVVATTGSTTTCRLQLDRTSNFNGAVAIELISPKDGSGISAEPVTLPADQSTLEIPIQIGPEVHPSNTDLLFRAVGQMTGDARMISEARVQLRLEAVSPSCPEEEKN